MNRTITQTKADEHEIIIREYVVDKAFSIVMSPPYLLEFHNDDGKETIIKTYGIIYAFSSGREISCAFEKINDEDWKCYITTTDDIVPVPISQLVKILRLDDIFPAPASYLLRSTLDNHVKFFFSRNYSDKSQLGPTTQI